MTKSIILLIVWVCLIFFSYKFIKLNILEIESREKGK